MRVTIVSLFSFVCAAAGWYYLLHASRAERLSGMERPADNRLRIRLRRWNGAIMIVMAVGFYVGFRIVEAGGNPLNVLICWGGCLLLTPAVLFLAYVDIRLTRKMREANRIRRK